MSSTSFHILKSLHNSLIIIYQYYKLHFFQCTQPNNHLSIECRINYGSKFNFIGIKKTEGVPKIFLKGRQIKFFKLLYIISFIKLLYINFLFQDHPDLKVALPLIPRQISYTTIRDFISWVNWNLRLITLIEWLFI